MAGDAPRECRAGKSLKHEWSLPCNAPREDASTGIGTESHIELAARIAHVIESQKTMKPETQDEPWRGSQAAIAPCRMSVFLSAAGYA